LLDVKGTLYGTASSGTVFSITTTGVVKMLHVFGGGSDGYRPYAGLISVHGTLYGTTASGGARGCFSSDGCGTVYSVTTGGTEQVLHAFYTNGSDGRYPTSNLLNVNGTLYGTTVYGGTHGAGTVYAITP
jgi:uncharacterized repeat protein (TIGR03803 family)